VPGNLVGRRLRLPAWAWPLLALPVVAGVGVWTYRTIAAAIQGRLESSLSTMLASNVSAVRQWLTAEANLAEVMAADPRVRAGVSDLIDLARRTAGDPAALKAAPAQAHLREILNPVVSRQENAGYFILDRGGLIIARIVDERIGDRLVLGVADAASKALAGQRAFLPATLKQRFANEPMAFLIVPLRDSSDAVVAAFAFRIRPEQMGAILNASRMGESGETYAVDADGRMVTDTRFPDQVTKLGLVPPESKGRTTAILELRDPGAQLVEGQVPPTPQKSWPLTWAAAEVVAGHKGVNANGYRDYRGVPVVGAWSWLPEWNVGIVTEIDRDEAYQTLQVLRRSFGVLGGGLLLVAGAIALSSRRIYGLQREVRRAERLGQYTLEDKIGEGGMGAVYRAKHAFLRRPTAVKLIRSEVASPEMLARFEREVQLTSQLTHWNTIAIFDYGRTPDGIFYYAMEHLPGLPLDQVIHDDGPQPEARVVHLVKQICASLAEAHRISLVHRDVKPANVMLCERGGTYDVVKVLDFGLVKSLDRGDQSGVTGVDDLVGTPLYMAPEAVMTASGVTPRSDVYAVGAVAYALLTGHDVFTGKSGVEVIGHHLHTTPKPPSERLGRPVTPFLERLIMNCLSKLPEDRPADAGAMLTVLEEGWTGPAWTQREAAAWWQTAAPAMLAARRAAEESISRGPSLAVDVSSRMRGRRSSASSSSLPEIHLAEEETAFRPRPGGPPKQP
jgi:eukaryotic-like serine/threonine-protein kinase